MSAVSSPPAPAIPEADVEAVRSELLTLLERLNPGASDDVSTPKPMTEPAAEGTSPPATLSAKEPTSASPSTEAFAGAPVPTCRQCGNLDSWGNASWCPKCGYYPALGHAGEIVPEEPAPLPQLAWSDLLPRWVIQIALGLAVVAGLSSCMERYLVGHPGFLTLCSIVQLSFGAIVALVAHVQAILVGMRDPHAPDLKTMLSNPFTVWRPVLRNLRERAYLLVTFSWGLSACVSAAMIYGPIRLAEMQRELAELRHRKTQRSVMGRMIGTLAQASAAEGEASLAGEGGAGDSDIEDAVENFTGLESAGAGEVAFGSANTVPSRPLDQLFSADENTERAGKPSPEESSSGGAALPSQGLLPEQEQREPPAGGRIGVAGINAEAGNPAGRGRETSDAPPQTAPRDAGLTLPEHQRLEAVIFGYLANLEGEVRTLLLAAPGPDGRPRYVGKLTREALSESQWNSLAEELPTRRVDRPLVACPHHGHWVEPQTILKLEFDRWSATGFVNARVTSIELRGGSDRR